MNKDVSHQVLSFWFGEQDPPAQAYQKRWFSGGGAIDRDIKARFGSLHDDVCHGLSAEELLNRESLLAAILVIDQFSRNLYRRSAKAFAWDAMAQDWSLQGWTSGMFDSFTPSQQAFAAMPLIHSENLVMHERAVVIYSKLKSTQPETDTIITGFYSSALQHHDIIAQFGRYPHRNCVLGRDSTDAEIVYLNDGAQRFGQ